VEIMSDSEATLRRRPIDLVLDFDGTLTTSDTTTALALITEQSRSCWQHVLDGWLDDSKRFKETPYQWVNHGHDEYSKWLDSHRSLEMSSVSRAQNCKMFKGVTVQDMRVAVDAALQNGEVCMRDGWHELIRLVKDNTHGSDVRILSANWSETFVRTILCAAAKRDAATGDPQPSLFEYFNDFEIFANEIHGLGSPCGSSGRLIRPFEAGIRTSGDKVKYFQHMTRRPDAVDMRRNGSYAPLTVYIGDSATDYGALCQADLGIWLCDIPHKDLGTRFNKIFGPLKAALPASLKTLEIAELVRAKQAEAGLHPRFYWSRDLHTVTEFLRKYGTFSESE
jgi:2-hydroxy-3-keto-5-methylthiopentenyl-1-phosphate phosphatase